MITYSLRVRLVMSEERGRGGWGVDEGGRLLLS